ncbi:hypothetical protein ACFSE0_13845 [Ochrobactrum teleogrylli]|uniref:Uncharacterized protein n=1 Tax=Ochrobactrum teleogrylli TaxID=2479765 RepID=A0ABY2Y448_9HYPH|nr:hypothetical protein [[Ochrobactrum] teleogrylli]TNV16142.1 hypothetical protein FIC94_09925 [[Ochrobactrum] teleogrylli]
MKLSEPGVTAVSGEIVQISASISQLDVSNQNVNRLYPFIMLKTGNGDVIRINDLVADVHIDQHVGVGLNSTFYLIKIRHMTKFKQINLALAAVSENGTGIIDLPQRLITSLFVMNIFIGCVSIFFCVGLLGPELAYFFGFPAIVLGALIGFGFFAHLLRSAMSFARARTKAERLRKKLIGAANDRDAYRGMAVKNI